MSQETEKAGVTGGTLVTAVCVILIAFATSVAALEKFVAFKPLEDLVTSAPKIFGSLLLVSLFVERMIEVFISLWADDNTDLIEQQLDTWQLQQQQLNQELDGLKADKAAIPATDVARIEAADTNIATKKTALDAIQIQIDTAQVNLIPFRAKTRRISTWAGLALGMLTSAVGFRLLDQIVYIPANFADSYQLQWFLVVDVILTGAVLSGGSQTVHQIFSLYESFMDAGQRKASNIGK